MKWSIIMVLLIVFVSIRGYAENPFFGSPGEQEPAQNKADKSAFSVNQESFIGLRTPGAQKIIGVQRGLHGKLSRFLYSMKENRTASTGRVLAGLGFLYGLLHALLPGHRKSILAAYFLTRKASPATGIGSGMLLGLLHAGSSVVIITVGYYLLNTALSFYFEETSRILSRISAVVIMGVAVIMLIINIRHSVSSKDEDNHTGKKQRRLLTGILLTGIIPCPGSAMILLMTISLGILPAGILTVAGMSLGIGVTLSSIAVLTIIAKNRALSFIQGKGNRILHHGLEYAGSLFLFLTGAVLLLF
ncbi:MAG: nickel/cobalt transporter [Spirochaetia bacterium]